MLAVVVRDGATGIGRSWGMQLQQFGNLVRTTLPFIHNLAYYHASNYVNRTFMSGGFFATRASVNGSLVASTHR